MSINQGKIGLYALTDGGPATTPNLQAVTGIGNTTTNPIIVEDLVRSITLDVISTLIGDSAAAIFKGTGGFDTSLIALDPSADRLIALPDKSGTVALLSDISTGDLQSVTDAGASTTNEMTVTGTGESVIHGTRSIKFEKGGNIIDLDTTNAITANRQQILQDADGTVALLEDLPVSGNFTQAGFTGTIITIPHGLAAAPTSCSIVAHNSNATALALSKGFFVAYSLVNITVTLSVAVVAPIAIDIDFTAFP